MNLQSTVSVELPSAVGPADHSRLPDSLMPSHDASVEIQRVQDVTVIMLGRAYETIDEEAVERVATPVLEAAREADPPWIVLDLSLTKFFGSSFIEVLFRAYNRLRERKDGRFAICGLTSYCREVVEVTHLDRLWKVYETCDEAVIALRNES